MMMVRALLVAATLVAGPATASAAEPERRCLSREQEREVVDSYAVVPIAVVIRNLRRTGAGELVRSNLCEVDGRHVYVVTVLRPSGRVVPMTFDARTGAQMAR